MAKKIIKNLVIVFLTIVVLTGVLYFALAMLFNCVKNKGQDELELKDLQELSKSVGDERINVLMLGVDSLDGKNKDNTMRTDTMMLLSIDPKTKTGFILSIPRDTRVHVEGLAKKFNKINEVHAIGGVSYTIKSVKALLGIEINHFVKVDYQAVNKTVNDIGGVEVNVPMDMSYDDPYAKPPLHIDLKQGPQILDGDKAMQFLRFRHGYANQDLGRIESQQKFIQALMDKLLSPESIVHITDYIDTFSQYVQTDLEFSDMLKIASKAIEIKPYNIKKAVVPGKADYLYGISYFIADEEQIKTQIKELYDGEKYYIDKPIPEVQPQNTQNASDNENTANGDDKAKQPDTKQNKPQQNVYDPYVVVLNGSGGQGLAQRAKDLLYINNIAVDATSNADKFDYNDTIIYYKNNITLAQEARTILGTGKIVQENKAYYDKPTDILVVLGSDFTK